MALKKPKKSKTPDIKRKKIGRAKTTKEVLKKTRKKRRAIDAMNEGVREADKSNKRKKRK